MPKEIQQPSVLVPATDAERLDWIEIRTSRAMEIYWHIENEGGTVREAIDRLAFLQARE